MQMQSNGSSLPDCIMSIGKVTTMNNEYHVNL